MLTAERPDTDEESAETARSQTVIERFREPRPPRTRRKRVILGALLAVLVVLSGLAIPTVLGVFPWLYTPPVPDNAAFVVGDRVVTIDEYNDWTRTLGALTGTKAPTDPAGADLFQREAAKAMMISTVIDEAEADEGVVIPDTKVQDQLNASITQQFGPGPDGYQKFVQGLGQAGTSEPAVLNWFKQEMGSVALIQKITNTVPRPADEELPAEFPKYKDRLGQPEARQISNIVVSDEAQAADLLNRIKGGQPFAQVAQQSSIDTSTKDKGGDLGELTRDQLQQGYANAAFSAPPGGLFGPVQTTQGWNVGQVVRVREAIPADFGRVIEQLRTVVWSDRKTQVWADYLRNKIDAEHVRFADAYQPADPTSIPATQNQPPS